MTQPPLQPPSPFGDDTDEAISALVDGRLDAFAAERDMTEADATAQLESWPGFPDRRSVLEQSRADVQASVAPLDDVTRRRLVRNALDAAPLAIAPAHRSRSWEGITAAAAAVLLVIAGIGVAISSMGGDDSKSSSSASAAAPLHGDVGDLGDVTSPAALRALLDRGKPPLPFNPATSTTLGYTSGAAADSASGSSESKLNSQSNRVAEAPPAASVTPAATIAPNECATQLAGDRRVAFVGTGTYQGAPVTIVGIKVGNRTIAFVVPSTDCTKVLTSISR